VDPLRRPHRVRGRRPGGPRRDDGLDGLTPGCRRPEHRRLRRSPARRAVPAYAASPSGVVAVACPCGPPHPGTHA
jgi:hypothetical protein